MSDKTANEMLILTEEKQSVFFLNFFASTDVNRMSVKVLLQQ